MLATKHEITGLLIKRAEGKTAKNGMSVGQDLYSLCLEPSHHDIQAGLLYLITK
jgi:hypothetical protein